MAEAWVVARRLFPGGGTAALPDRAVRVEDRRIATVVAAGAAPSDAPVYEVLAPGFVDVQINGGGGVLFNDAPTPDTLNVIAAAARKGGTAHILPTFITAPGDAYAAAMEAVAQAMARGTPGVEGLHLEGPFLSPARPGIHPAGAIRIMTQADAARLRAFPRPLMLTVAPEAQPAPLLADLAAQGVRVFAGHTEADVETITAARWLTGVTHLWNAMSQLGSRAPGCVGAALASDRLMAGIIADGHHVHPSNLAFAARAMGTRLFLVTDAMATLGTDLTGFHLMGTPIALRDGRLVGPDGTLAGAHLAMDAAVRRMVGSGVTEARALDMASGRPARAAALDGLGRIAPGTRASLTALDKELHARAVMVDGVWR